MERPTMRLAGLVLLASAGGCTLSGWPFGKSEPTAADVLRSPGVGQKAPKDSGGMFAAIWPGEEVKPDAGPPKTYLDANDPLNPTGQATVPPSVFVQQAEIAEAKGDAAAAIASYERALKLDPKFTAAHLGLARLHDRAGDYAAAAGAYKAAIDSEPENPSCHNDFGTFLARHKDHPTAAMAFGRAAELDPKNVLYRNNLAVVLVGAGETDRALRELADVHPPAVAHHNVAYLLKEQGQTAAARTHAQEAVRLDANLEPARKLLASLEGPAGGTTLAGGKDGPTARLAQAPTDGLVGQSGTVHDPTRAAVVGGEVPLQKQTVPIASGSSVPDWAALPGAAPASAPSTGSPAAPTRTPAAPPAWTPPPGTPAPTAPQASRPPASTPSEPPSTMPPWLRTAQTGPSGPASTGGSAPGTGGPTLASSAAAPFPGASSALPSQAGTTQQVSYQADANVLAPVVPLR